MIAADALELEANLRQMVIHIRQKEVELFTDQFGVLASISTFMASLGFGALTMSTNFLERGHRENEYCSDLVGCTSRGKLFNNEVAITIYFGLTAFSIFCNFVVVFIAVYCGIFGPELAIRGEVFEQERAIRGMYAERRTALRFFWVACASIVVAGGALGWLKYPTKSAAAMTAVFSLLLGGSSYYVTHLTPLFSFEEVKQRQPTREFYVASKAAPLDVNGIPRHGIVSDSVLRIFDMAGTLVDTIHLLDTSLDLNADGMCFWLVVGQNKHRLAGADFDDTQHWIRAIVANIRHDYANFSDDDDGDDDESKVVVPRRRRAGARRTTVVDLRGILPGSARRG